MVNKNIMIRWWSTLLTMIAYVSFDSAYRSRCCMAFTTSNQPTASSFVFYYFTRPSLWRMSKVLNSSKATTSTFINHDDDDGTDQRQKLFLQNLLEPFDRWRFLQKLLDEDINDASDVLFLLQTSIKQQLQQQRKLEPVTSLPPPQLTVEVEAEASRTDATTIITNEIGIEEVSSVDIYSGSDEGTKRRRIMDYIINDVSSQTIHNLLSQPQPQQYEADLYLLQQMERLLPHPENDEDASKGLWDTVIELHGRESVKINERPPQSTSWKTRCIVTRLLIYYDFLTIGFIQ